MRSNQFKQLIKREIAKLRDVTIPHEIGAVQRMMQYYHGIMHYRTLQHKK